MFNAMLYMRPAASRWSAVTLILGLLVGCTTPPQIMPVTPRPALSAESGRGGGRTIAIEVIDARAEKDIGLRDAKVAESAITPAPEMLPNILSALQAGYRGLGFKVLPAGSAADIVLQVRLSELGYQREASGVLPDLKTGAAFAVTSTMPEKSVEAIYRDAQTKDTVIKPSRSANAELINSHVDAALAKLINDPRLTEP